MESLLLVSLLLLSASVYAQLDCDEVTYDDMNSPVSGNNLTFCSTPDLQCCSNNGLMGRRAGLRNDVLNGLRDLLGNNNVAINDVYMNLKDYTERVFVRRFVRAFSSPNLNKSYENDLNIIENQFITNLFITEDNTDFNTAAYVQNIIDAVIVITIETTFAPHAAEELTPENQLCIRGELLDRINETVQNRIAGSLEQLRRAVTAVRRIRMFYQEFSDNITNPSTRIINECTNAFVNLHCAGCREEIRDTCRATCLTVLRACFSPYYSQLTGQLNVLWNVTNQCVSTANRLTRALGRDPDRLLTFDINNPQEVLSTGFQILRTCGIEPSVPSKRSIRQADDDDDDDDEDDDDDDDDGDGDDDNDRFSLPANVTRRADDLDRAGVFNYRNGGPGYCRNRGNNNCWNGETNNAAEEREDFTGNTVEEQRNNPLIETVGINITVLEEERQELGTPVTDFLTSRSFDAVIPEGVSIPEDMGDATPSGVATTMASLVIVVAASVFAVFM